MTENHPNPVAAEVDVPNPGTFTIDGLTYRLRFSLGRLRELKQTHGIDFIGYRQTSADALVKTFESIENVALAIGTLLDPVAHDADGQPVEFTVAEFIDTIDTIRGDLVTLRDAFFAGLRAFFVAANQPEAAAAVRVMGDTIRQAAEAVGQRIEAKSPALVAAMADQADQALDQFIDATTRPASPAE